MTLKETSTTDHDTSKNMLKRAAKDMGLPVHETPIRDSTRTGRISSTRFRDRPTEGDRPFTVGRRVVREQPYVRPEPRYNLHRDPQVIKATVSVGNEPATAEEKEWAAKGPWLVKTIRNGWYNVRHVETDKCRSALGDEDQAIKLAAKFNLAETP